MNEKKWTIIDKKTQLIALILLVGFVIFGASAIFGWIHKSTEYDSDVFGTCLILFIVGAVLVIIFLLYVILSRSSK